MVLVILVVLVVFDNVLVDSTLCWLFMVLVILVVFDNVFVGFNSVFDIVFSTLCMFMVL